MEFISSEQSSTNGYREQQQQQQQQQPNQTREHTEHFYQPAEEQIELELTKHSVITTTSKMEDEHERMLKVQQQQQTPTKEGVETTHTVIEMQGSTAPAGTKASQTENNQRRHHRYQQSRRSGGGTTPGGGGGDASNLSAGLNMYDRDEKNINKHVELMFEDIMAEPDGMHSFDFIFSSSFLTFTMCRYWVYRVLTAILAIPLAVIWALIFAVLTIVNNWLVMPTLRVLGVVFTWIQLLIRVVVHNVCDPLFESIGKVFYNVRYTPTATGGLPPPGGFPPPNVNNGGGYGGYPYQYQPLPTSAPPTAAATTTFDPTVIGYHGSQPTSQQRIVHTQLM